MLVAFTVYFATSLVLRPLERKRHAHEQTRKILLGVGGVYLVLAGRLVVVIFGSARRDNEEFEPQNEFKLDTWIDLPGRSTSTRPCSTCSSPGS